MQRPDRQGGIARLNTEGAKVTVELTQVQRYKMAFWFISRSNQQKKDNNCRYPTLRIPWGITLYG